MTIVTKPNTKPSTEKKAEKTLGKPLVANETPVRYCRPREKAVPPCGGCGYLGSYDTTAGESNWLIDC